GINTAVANPALAQNVGFAIPITEARPIIDTLRAGKRLAFLGVGTTDVGSDAASAYSVHADHGGVVIRVSPGSPAAAAGLRPGDVILQIGDDRIDRSSDVAAAIRHRAA